MNVGESTTLQATALDEYEESLAIDEITSSNPDVVEVTQEGSEYTITAKANGVASIVASATLSDGSSVEGYTPIIVGTEPIDGAIYQLTAPASEVSALFA